MGVGALEGQSATLAYSIPELDTCLSLGFEYQGLVVSRAGQSQGLAIDVLHNLDGLGVDLAIRGHGSGEKCEAHFFLDQEV